MSSSPEKTHVGYVRFKHAFIHLLIY